MNERWAREERKAWDVYAAAYMTAALSPVADTVSEAAEFADVMLAERRKRFEVDDDT